MRLFTLPSVISCTWIALLPRSTLTHGLQWIPLPSLGLEGPPIKIVDPTYLYEAEDKWTLCITTFKETKYKYIKVINDIDYTLFKFENFPSVKESYKGIKPQVRKIFHPYIEVQY